MEQYARSGIPFYWRIEQIATGVPLVYTYVLDPATQKGMHAHHNLSLGVAMYSVMAFLPGFFQTPTKAGYGYGASFPIKWISRNGRDLWLKWAANFDGCAPKIDCSGGYGFNYRRMHLIIDGDG